MKISLLRYADALYTIGKIGQQTERALKLKAFVGLLAREKKLSVLPRILEVYTRIYNAKEKVASLTTYTAHALPLSALGTIREAYQGVTLEHQNIQDTNLIGGIAIKMNDDILDYTIAGTLNQLTQRIASL